MAEPSSKSSTQTSSLPATLPRSSVENGEFQTANETCSKGDAAADARIQKLEQELHILEEELENGNQLLWEENENMYADAVHNSTREATASPDGTYQAR
jgi:TolA-binding protein